MLLTFSYLFLGIKGGYPAVILVNIKLEQKILTLMVYYLSNPNPVKDFNEVSGLFTRDSVS
jgi:hypothetical protein